MSTFVSGPPFLAAPAAQRFTDRTYALIEKLIIEPSVLRNLAVMASDFLLDHHGPEARWRDLEIDALAAYVRRQSAMFAMLIERHRVELAEFARVADEHHGIELPPATGDGVFLSAIDDADLGADPARAAAPRNRAERRSMARHARRTRARR
jgi:hypothetical protein